MKFNNVTSVVCLCLASITLTSNANANITLNAASDSFEPFDLDHLV